MKLEINGIKMKVCKETFRPGGCMTFGIEIDDPGTISEINRITADFKKNDIFLDVGANTGLMSLAINKGKCIAFEPTPEIYRILVKNVLLNNKPIQPVNIAVQNKPRKYGIIREANHGNNHVTDDKKSNLKSVTIDELKLKKVKLIKIDTEGDDNNVLLGAEKTIKKWKPIILIEMNPGDILTNWEYIEEKRVGNNNLWRPK